MSERRAEPSSPDGEQPFRVPGQYSLVGQVAGWNREPGAQSWGSKGELLTQRLAIEDLPPRPENKYLFFLNLCFLDTVSEEHTNIWGTWHTTLKPILKDQQFTGNQSALGRVASPKNRNLKDTYSQEPELPEH